MKVHKTGSLFILEDKKGYHIYSKEEVAEVINEEDNSDTKVKSKLQVKKILQEYNKIKKEAQKAAI
jgi:hypothetical protein